MEVVFRGAHSLKGMSAAMGYERTADLTHKMESLMDTVRKREQAVDRRLVDLMLRAVDTVKIAHRGRDGRHDRRRTPAEIVEELAARTAAGVRAGLVAADAAGSRRAESGAARLGPARTPTMLVRP